MYVLANILMTVYMLINKDYFVKYESICGARSSMQTSHKKYFLTGAWPPVARSLNSRVLYQPGELLSKHSVMNGDGSILSTSLFTLML
jgi:hypothetical protein